jgi:hypothetical protein
MSYVGCFGGTRFKRNMYQIVTKSKTKAQSMSCHPSGTKVSMQARSKRRAQPSWPSSSAFSAWLWTWFDQRFRSQMPFSKYPPRSSRSWYACPRRCLQLWYAWARLPLPRHPCALRAFCLCQPLRQADTRVHLGQSTRQRNRSYDLLQARSR